MWTPAGSRRSISYVTFFTWQNLGSLGNGKQNILQGWPYTNSSHNIYLQMLHLELILSAWTQLHENTLQVWLDHCHTSPNKSWSECQWIQKFVLAWFSSKIHIHLITCKLCWTNNTLQELWGHLYYVITWFWVQFGINNHK